MPRLAVCSRDLHWHWINWTLLCDTMEVSMLRLAWLPITQHTFQAALTGRLELISRKIVSSEQGHRLSRWADFAKNCLPRIECKELPRFRKKYRALGRHVCKNREIGGQKMGSNMRPRYIQFRNIYGRDISGLHCIDYVEYLGPGLTWGRILSTYIVSMWRNDIKCNYMFMFPLKILARKGLIHLLFSHSTAAALTHWGRDQIDAISQTTFSNAFSRMKMNEFRLGFHWSLFLRLELTIFQHWFR